MYALKVTCKEAHNIHGQVVTEAGQVVWVVRDEWGWSGSRGPLDRLANLITFETREEAEKEAKAWKGNPWYYAPERVEVVEVDPLYQRVTGWKVS